MKVSPRRHPLAVLRLLIGFTQGEMAELVGVSRRAIQSVELGTLTLSEKLASRISEETGVDIGWLLDGDARADIKDINGAAYESKTFDLVRSKKMPAGKNREERIGRLITKFATLLFHAEANGYFPMGLYSAEKSIDMLMAQLGSDYAAERKGVVIEDSEKVRVASQAFLRQVKKEAVKARPANAD